MSAIPISIHIAPSFIIVTVNRIRYDQLGHHHLRKHHLGHHHNRRHRHSHHHLWKHHRFAAKYDGSGKNW
jgi:hypothetical protein